MEKPGAFIYGGGMILPFLQMHFFFSTEILYHFQVGHFAHQTILEKNLTEHYHQFYIFSVCDKIALVVIPFCESNLVSVCAAQQQHGRKRQNEDRGSKLKETMNTLNKAENIHNKEKQAVMN